MNEFWGTFPDYILIVVTIVGLISAGHQFYKQHRLDFYAKYTDRYLQLMKEMPLSIWYGKKYSAKDEDNDIYRVVRQYFELCSEEFYLSQTGYIEKNVWEDWKEGMSALFNKESINLCLQEIVRVDGDNYPDFIEFLKYDLQIKNI